MRTGYYFSSSTIMYQLSQLPARCPSVRSRNLHTQVSGSPLSLNSFPWPIFLTYSSSQQANSGSHYTQVIDRASMVSLLQAS